MEILAEIAWAEFLPTLVIALVVLIIGTIVNKLIMRIIRRGMGKSKVDKTLYIFAQNLIKVVLTVILLVIVLNVLGISMTSIIAVIGSAGIAVGLAMKDSLANVAAGILVLYGKIFKVGDYIDVNGVGGTVTEIGIAYTKLLTPDYRDIYMPNTSVANSTVINYNGEAKRRLDFNIKLDYSVETEKAKKLLEETAQQESRIIKEEGIFCRLTELNSEYQVISARVWVKAAEYWDVNFDMLEKIKSKFDEENITLFANKLNIKSL